MLLKVIEFLSQNPYVTVASMIITLIAFIVAIFQIKRKQLGYYYQTTLIIEDSLSKLKGLDISFRGEKLDTLSVTSIKLFNNGNTIIEKDDIYKKHTILIRFNSPKVKILNEKVVYQSSDTIEASVFERNDGISVSFESMEKNEYIIIYIYHTGDINPKFVISGKIKEGRLINYKKKEKNSENIIIAIWIPFYIISLIIGTNISEAILGVLYWKFDMSNTLYMVIYFIFGLIPPFICWIIWNRVVVRRFERITEIWVDD